MWKKYMKFELYCFLLELSCFLLELSCFLLELYCFLLELYCFLLELYCFLLELSCFLLELYCFLLELYCFLLELSCFLLELSCFLLELSCFLLELSCFLPIHDIFHVLCLYISILHKGEQLVPFKFVVVVFFCTLQRKIICVLPISYWTALMRHKFSKWPYAEPKYIAILVLLFLLSLGRRLRLVDC